MTENKNGYNTRVILKNKNGYNTRVSFCKKRAAIDSSQSPALLTRKISVFYITKKKEKTGWYIYIWSRYYIASFFNIAERSLR